MEYVTGIKYPETTKMPLITPIHTIWNGNIQFLPPYILYGLHSSKKTILFQKKVQVDYMLYISSQQEKYIADVKNLFPRRT